MSRQVCCWSDRTKMLTFCNDCGRTTIPTVIRFGPVLTICPPSRPRARFFIAIQLWHSLGERVGASSAALTISALDSVSMPGRKAVISVRLELVRIAQSAASRGCDSSPGEALDDVDHWRCFRAWLRVRACSRSQWIDAGRQPYRRAESAPDSVWQVSAVGLNPTLTRIDAGRHGSEGRHRPDPLLQLMDAS